MHVLQQRGPKHLVARLACLKYNQLKHLLHMLPNINQAKNYKLVKIWSGGPDGMPRIIVNKYCKPYTRRCLLHEHINNTFENLVHLTVNKYCKPYTHRCLLHEHINNTFENLVHLTINKYCKPYTCRCLLHEHINNTFENLVRWTRWDAMYYRKQILQAIYP